MPVGTVTRDFILDGSLVETRFSFAQATAVGVGILTAGWMMGPMHSITKVATKSLVLGQRGIIQVRHSA